MAQLILRAWWDRLRGRLQPSPCPYTLAGVLDMPGRQLLAGPARILAAFGICSGQTVVEIGPGTGFYSLEAARRVGPSGRLICVDIQEEMLRETRRRMEAAGLAADFVRADARRLPFRSASVDHAYLVTVLGEIPERDTALLEIKRVLRSGGHLSVSEQFPDPDFVTVRTLRRELGATGFTEEKTRGHGIYTSTWSRGS